MKVLGFFSLPLLLIGYLGDFADAVLNLQILQQILDDVVQLSPQLNPQQEKAVDILTQCVYNPQQAQAQYNFGPQEQEAYGVLAQFLNEPGFKAQNNHRANLAAATGTPVAANNNELAAQLQQVKEKLDGATYDATMTLPERIAHQFGFEEHNNHPLFNRFAEYFNTCQNNPARAQQVYNIGPQEAKKAAEYARRIMPDAPEIGEPSDHVD